MSKTPETPPVYVLLVYLYSKDKASQWALVTQADIDSGTPLAQFACDVRSYSAKMGRHKIVGSVYQVGAKDPKGDSVFPSTAQWKCQWPVAEDRAEWLAREKAHTLEKQAKNAEPVQEILVPLLQRYQRLPFGARAVLLHQVIRAFTRVK